MKRLIALSLFAWLILAAALPAAAQDQPPPPDDPATMDLDLILSEARAAADRAEAAADRATELFAEMEGIEERAMAAVDLANSMFTFFEVMSAVVGIVVPVLIVIGGILGFRRLEQANQELREARERFETEMEARSQELDQVRENLEESGRIQREQASASSIALALLPVGERQYRAQDYSGALDTYRRALQFDPRNPIIHYRLGYVYTQSGELDSARESLEAALRLDPQFVPAQAALGYVYRRMGDGIGKDIDRMIDAGADANAPEVREQQLRRDKTYIKSEDHFVEALSTLPKLMDEDGESWWGALGGLYRRRGQTEQAIRAYERGTQVTPQSSYPFSNLALLYAEVGNFARMQETYRRVEQLAWGETQADVDNYWAYADLIVSRMAQGKVQETYEVLDTALETAPADSPYTLDSLMDTLGRLASYLPHDRRAPIEDVIQYIRNFISARAQREAESRSIVAEVSSTQEMRAIKDKGQGD